MKKNFSLIILSIICTTVSLQSAQLPSEPTANTPTSFDKDALEENHEEPGNRQPKGSRQGLETKAPHFSPKLQRPVHTRKKSTASHTEAQQALLQAATPSFTLAHEAFSS